MSAEQRSFWESGWGRAPTGVANIPPRAPVRRSDPDTSKRAAASLTPGELCLSQSEVLAALQAGPLTDEQLCGKVAALMSPSRARTARKELVEMRRVKACGEAKTARGKPCIVWGLA